MAGSHLRHALRHPVREWPPAVRRTVLVLAGVLLVLLVIRALLPIAIQRYANRTLDETEGYAGHIGDVDLALWRGHYEIEDIEIVKDDGDVPVPLFAAPRVHLSVEWGALFRGALVGEIHLDRPQVNFVRAPGGETQTGAEADWRKTVEELFPLRIDSIEARDGSVHYRDLASEPNVDVYLDDVDLVVRNLTNSRDVSETLVATVDFSAVPMKQGRVELKASFDPFAEQPTFDVDATIRDARLAQWNDFFRAYAGFDVQSGRFAVFSELRAEQGRFDGYVKPFLRDVDVLRIEEELQEQGVLASAWEAIVGAGAELFQDQDKDRQASRIPISGAGTPQVGFWGALASTLRNAFFESLVPRLEHSVGD
ncbi:MAG: hypothetical protein DCC71_17230 [Proteobacteria bacterium]|nr:MAG: hypothetical protein DCC71_17230 [Pseudomonadota bacterium]